MNSLNVLWKLWSSGCQRFKSELNGKGNCFHFNMGKESPCIICETISLETKSKDPNKIIEQVLLARYITKEF
jgi:hypothetical protein